MRQKVIFVMLAVLCAAYSCIRENLVKVTDITLDNTSVELNLGDTLHLTASLFPLDATDKGIRWSSTDTKVATVSDGLVKALSAGDVTIVVTSVSGGATATCTIKVKAPVEGVYLDKHEIELYEGESADITATLNTADVHVKPMKWSSNNGAMVKVMGGNGTMTTSEDGSVSIVSSGTIVAVKAAENGGYTTIFAASGDGKNCDSCKVTVKCHVTDLVLDKKELELNEGESVALPLTVIPERATDKTCTWTSNNPDVAIVNSEGYVTGISTGTTKVCVESADGKHRADCKVTVSRRVTGISIWKGGDMLLDTLTLAKGTKCTLTTKIEPEGASNQHFTWKSTNKNVVTVSPAGEISAIEQGFTALTVISEDGAKTASCNVHVVVPVNKMVIDWDPSKSGELYEGESIDLKASVYPTDATDKTIRWDVSDPNIASVSNGRVTAIKAPVDHRTVTVEAVTSDGNFREKYTLSVKCHVEAVKLDCKSLILKDNESRGLAVEVIPERASDKSIEWSSSDPGIVSVSSTGRVTAKSKGTATITVTTKDGSFTDTCKVEVIRNVTGIAIRDENGKDVSALQLKKNDVKTLQAELTPSGVTCVDVVWTSSDASVVTVDSSGKITAIKAGKATIMAASVDGAKVDLCNVTVTVPVTGVVLNNTSVTMFVGDCDVFKATVQPEDATYESLQWSSDNADVTVSDDGHVKVVKKSTTGEKAQIKVSVGGFYDVCTVSIKAHVTNVTLDKSHLDLIVGESEILKATCSPSIADDKSLNWSSDKPGVASVDAGGRVTAVSPGTATISAISTDGGHTSKCTVSVEEGVIHVTSIVLNPHEITMEIGESKSVGFSVYPEKASDKSVIWSSSNNSIVEVAGGVLHAVSDGTAEITATTADGKKTDKCTVTVELPQVSSVSFESTTKTVEVGSTFELKANVYPSNARDRSLTWTSSNESCCTVNPKGLVTAVSKGTATITATTQNGKKDICTLTVTDKVIHVTSVKISRDRITLHPGEKYQLTCTVLPEDATDKRVIWGTGNSGVLVDNGLVTALSTTAVVNVHSVDGNVSAICIVTVEPKELTGLSIDKTAVTMRVGETLTLHPLFTPVDATDKKTKWESDNNGIVTVSNGKLTAKGAGQATISVTSGNFKATCRVTVASASPNGMTTQNVGFDTL